MKLEMLLMHPAVQALGRALLEFVWQGAAVAALLAAVNFLLRRAAATWRYAAACGAMLVMLGGFAATVVEKLPYAMPVVASPAAAGVPMHAGEAVHYGGVAGGRPLPAEPVSGLPGWVACLWLVGVAALSTFTAVGWVRVQRWKRQGTEPANPAWIEMLDDLKRRLRVSRPVRLCTSAMAEVPAAIGWVRPYILLPVTAMTGLNESQLRAILAHELAHIRRHDYLVNLLQSAVETLLFYHPAVWWVGRQIRRERENCCDDIAVEVCGDAVEYAGALAEMEEIRARIPEPALAANGGELLGRIRRLLGESEARAGRSMGSIVAAGLALAMAIAPGMVALRGAPQGERPAFDVTSVKPNKSGDIGQYFRPSGGGMSITNMPLKDVMMFAYNVRRFQITGGPAWIETENYDIEGRGGAGNPSADQQRLMVQSLLADRFKLALHKEIKEQPIYELTVTKSGLKIQALKPGGCLPVDPKNPLTAAAGKTLLDYCGYGGFGRGFFEAASTSMKELAQSLSIAVDRTVVDRTGVQGTFRIHLAYVRDETMPTIGPRNDVNNPPPPADSGPSIFTALQEQLGLKLESGKGPVEVLVIDHVEKPTEN